MSPQHRTPYDVVVATRNRFDALAVSLPLILDQSPPPSRLIIVDSSEDPSAVLSLASSLSNPHGVAVEVVGSAPGLTLQRNVGLGRVSAEIVFFPDDDAMWHPGYADHVLAAYDRDDSRLVAGVGGAEVRSMPSISDEAIYTMSKSARLVRKLTPYRHRLESKWFPPPVTLAAQRLMLRTELPAWVDKVNIVPVEYVSGFRMSFRTAFIKDVGFDEDLTGYSMFEDLDVSLCAWHHHVLLADHRARVVHHKRPGGRESGWRDGYLHLWNYAYVVCKHAPTGTEPRRQLRRWAWYRCLLYGLRIRSWETLRRACGAAVAAKRIRVITDAPDHHRLRAVWLAYQ